jgi:hypothetical protein
VNYLDPEFAAGGEDTMQVCYNGKRAEVIEYLFSIYLLEVIIAKGQRYFSHIVHDIDANIVDYIEVDPTLPWPGTGTNIQFSGPVLLSLIGAWATGAQKP